MDVKVVDASALAAILFAEVAGMQIAEQIDNTFLVAPELIDFELANVCLVKLRRHPAEAESLTMSFQARRHLNVERVAVDIEATLALAIETGLTAYDASYLWLARKLGAELVTLDKQLVQAAKA